jgi:hypothetical protein
MISSSEVVTIPNEVPTDARKLAAEAIMLADVSPNFSIATREQFYEAGEYLKEVKRLQRELENKRTSATGPLNAVIRTVNEWFKGPALALVTAEQRYKLAMAKFADAEQKKLDDARRAAEKNAREEQEELQRRAARAAEQGKIEKAQDLTVKAAEVQVEKPDFAPAKISGVGFGVDWCFEVVDPTQIPARFMTPDLVRIGQVVRAEKEHAQAQLGKGVRVYSKPRVIAGRGRG